MQNYFQEVINKKAPELLTARAFESKLMNLSESGKWVSNPRPSAWEADALPTELLPQCVCKFKKIFVTIH